MSLLYSLPAKSTIKVYFLRRYFAKIFRALKSQSSDIIIHNDVLAIGIESALNAPYLLISYKR